MKKYSLSIFGILALSEVAAHACSLSFFSSITEFDPQVPSTPRIAQQIHTAPVYIALMTHQPVPAQPPLTNKPSSGGC